MSDADKDLSVKIKIAADTAGGKKASEALDDFSKKTEEAGKKADFLGLRMGELKKLTRELAREFPLAGQAARLMMNPIAAAFTIAIGLFAKAKEKLDEWNKSLDEAAAKFAEGTFLEAIVARREAMEQGEAAAEKFAYSLQHLVREDEEYQKTIQAGITALHDRATAQDQIGNAKFGFDVAALKQALEGGLVEETEYYVRLGEIEKQHEADKLARERKLHADEIAALKDSVAESSAGLPGKIRKARELRGGATQGKANLDADEATLAALEKNLPELNKKVQAAIAEVEAFQPGGDPYKKKEAQERLDALVGERKIGERKAAALRANLPAGRMLVSDADSDAAMAEAIAKATAENIGRTQSEIGLKSATYSAQEKSAFANSLSKQRNHGLENPHGPGQGKCVRRLYRGRRREMVAL